MIFYTDGSCLGNGKANATGGYGIVGVDEITDNVDICVCSFYTSFLYLVW